MKRIFALIVLLGCHRHEHNSGATERATKGRDQAVMGGESVVHEAAAPLFRVHRRPFFVDVNGDGHDDAIVVGDWQGGPFAYAALDGTDGHVLWTSEALPQVWNDPMLVVNRTLLTYNGAGYVAAYEFKGSKPIWRVPLGERVERFCETADPTTTRVELVDKRSLTLTLATGDLVASTDKAPCRRLMTDKFSLEQEYSEPVGASARVGDHIQCGKTKTHADPCPARAQMDLETLDGIGVSELVVIDGGFVLLGVHRPGTGYPVVGVIRARALVWKSDVPDGNPLLAQDRPPFSSVMSNGELFVSYPAGRTAFVTAFSIATGHRDWLVQFKFDRAPQLYASNDTIFAFAELSDTLVTFAPDTGATRFVLDRGY